jgi:hypothetical protein
MEYTGTDRFSSLIIGITTADKGSPYTADQSVSGIVRLSIMLLMMVNEHFHVG